MGSFVLLNGAIEVEGTLSGVRIPDEDNEEVSDVIELDEDVAFKADKSLCPLCGSEDCEEAYPELLDDVDGPVILSLKAVLKPEEGALKLLWLDLLCERERELAPVGDADLES